MANCSPAVETFVKLGAVEGVPRVCGDSVLLAVLEVLLLPGPEEFPLAVAFVAHLHEAVESCTLAVFDLLILLDFTVLGLNLL